MSNTPKEFNAQVKPELFRELAPQKIREILLISSSYNIYNMEEDGSLTSKIVNEYKGLNLSCPPRITGVSSVERALLLLKENHFDLVFMVPHLEGMAPLSLGLQIKEICPDIPVILLLPGARGILSELKQQKIEGIDWTFTWSGNTDLLPAMVKLTEDRLNARHDTCLANVRVIILVEDSPEYAACLLPMIYREILSQTQSIIKTGCNDSLKLAAMGKRPKVLLATTYEEAMTLYDQYGSHLLCVISDTRLPRAEKEDAGAGISILSKIQRDIPEIPLLLMSTETKNKEKARQIPAVFLDKNVSDLNQELRHFFRNHLGFGDFVFRTPEGRQIDRASNLKELEEKLAAIPDESVLFHAGRNHFSTWLMARCEIGIGLQFRAVKTSDFNDVDGLRCHILRQIRDLRIQNYKGLTLQFDSDLFDAEIMGFAKIGHGSIGGKARGLAFMADLLSRHPEIRDRYPEIKIQIPKTLVLCTDIFDGFVADNQLKAVAQKGLPVEVVVQKFIDAPLPGHLTQKLETFLDQVRVPLAVRSSSQLEDDPFAPYAGLYKTYKIPNNSDDPAVRLDHLVTAVKLVYASTYYKHARTFCKNTSALPLDDTMAVMIQELAGSPCGDYFYPGLSGTAQSNNFYPFSHMKAEDGVVHMALGLGKTVSEGGKNFRFCPRYPGITPQLSTAQDFLTHTQDSFYALKIKGYPEGLHFSTLSNLEHRQLVDALEEPAVKAFASTYVAGEDRIRDSWYCPGPKVLTFARVLKYDDPPLAGVINDLLSLGKEGMGAVEIEFAVKLPDRANGPWEFLILQARPMASPGDQSRAVISRDDQDQALCVSAMALGNGTVDTVQDIVYVRPGRFKRDKTRTMAREISRINRHLIRENRPFLLAGPGRWGSSDHWLGIPVNWPDISGVGAIVEIRNTAIHADPSRGSHFYHNITSMGIPYITVNETCSSGGDRFNVQGLDGVEEDHGTEFIGHLRLNSPLVIKIDGKHSRCVILETQTGTNTIAA
jgi:hypothetical protein